MTTKSKEQEVPKDPEVSKATESFNERMRRIKETMTLNEEMSKKTSDALSRLRSESAPMIGEEAMAYEEKSDQDIKKIRECLKILNGDVKELFDRVNALEQRQGTLL